MAKDPAFLFYPGDYISGTMHLDFECKGAYIDLLMLQFQKDHMTLHMIRHMLSHKFDHIWPQISDKFKVKDGLYWNERLRLEKESRSNYCKSRKRNRNNYKHTSPHMSQHMEDEDEDEDEDINTVKKNAKSKKNKTPQNMSTAKDTADIPLPFKGPAFASIWAEWLRNRKEARVKNYTPTGLRRLFKWLVTASGDDEQVAIQIIDQSLVKGWQGLFELKPQHNGNPTTRITEKPQPTGTVAKGGFGQF